MDSDCGSQIDQKPKLALKSAEIHVERLKKLKQKLSFETPQISHYTHSRGQSFSNTKFSISRQTSSNLNPFGQSFRRQENQVPNKSNYFQSMNLKKIDSENKILYKKIQKIVKRKTTNLISQQRNQLRKSNPVLENLEEPAQNDTLNVTSDLAEDMIKNRATRSMIKQQNVTEADESKADDTDTQNSESDKKTAVNFKKIDLQKTQTQKSVDGESNNLMPKKFSFDSSHYGKSEPEYEIPSNITKKQHISSYQQRTERLMSESPTAAMFRRTNTEPIQSLDSIKLPSLSPNNTTSIYLFNPKEKLQDQIRKRARSQNLQYLETSKSLSAQKQKFQITSFAYKSNSTHNVLRQESISKSLSKTKNALEKQKVLSDHQLHKSSPKKFILLAEIEKKVQNLNVRFRFVRFNSFYEIQIKEKKSSKKEKNLSKDAELPKQPISSIKSQTSTYFNLQPVPSSQPFGIRKTSAQKPSKTKLPPKKLKLLSGIISLEEEMGSVLFSSFDYDYHRIIETCLTFYIRKDNTLNIEMKEQYKAYSKKTVEYQPYSIRQNDQDEEQDSGESVRQE